MNAVNRLLWCSILAAAACGQSVVPRDGEDAADSTADSHSTEGCDGAALVSARPIYPPSGAVFTSRAVRFRWTTTARTSAVEVCSDRSCGRVVARVNVGAQETTIPDLPAGALYWRVVPDGCVRATSVAWQVYVASRTASVGAAWSGPVDVNGDGYSDLAVVQFNPDRVLLYVGGAMGIATTPVAVLDSSRIPLGVSDWVGSAGDVDGDGIVDLFVASDSTVHVFFGETSGSFSRSDSLFPAPGGPRSNPRVAGAGDVNGDGYADLLVGSSSRTAGSSWLYYGTSRGFPLTPDVTLRSPPDVRNFGGDVGGVGDVNADGYSDIVVTAPGPIPEGTSDAILFFGTSAGPDLARPVRLPRGSPSNAGGFVRGSGDVNGDGYPDVLFYDANVGSAIYLGASAGDPQLFTRLTRAVYPVLPAFDVTGDGLDDIVAQRQSLDPPSLADVYLSNRTGLIQSWSAIVEGRNGFSMTTGDYNGDGLGDVAVGVPEAGEVRIYYGTAAGLPATPSAVIRGPAGGQFGQFVASLREHGGPAA